MPGSSVEDASRAALPVLQGEAVPERWPL